MKQLSVLVFHDFETLDVFGPVEIFGRLTDHYSIKFYSLSGGLITNRHNVEINTLPLEKIFDGTDIFLIPGGYGTRIEVNNFILLDAIKKVCSKSNRIMTVCTGSGLLAKTGLLDHKNATSNKKAFDWASAQSESVKWNKKARWTKDDNYYTSAGVSAGMDLSLAILEEIHGKEFAELVAFEIEYKWDQEEKDDVFYLKYK